MPDQTYLNLLRRFGVLLVIATVLGGVSAYQLSNYVTPTYETTTTLLVTQQQIVTSQGATPGTVTTVPAQLAESARVAAVLGQLVKTQPVLERAAAADLNGYTVGDLTELIEVDIQEVFLLITGSASTAADAQLLSSTVTDAFLAMVAEGVATGPVAVTVMEPAGEPLFPVSPRKTLNAAAGAMFGLVAAASLALLLVRMDDVVRNERQVQAATGLPTLGLLPATPKSGGPELVRLANSSGSRFTEAVRAVRANLSVVMGARPQRGYERSVLLVTSVREGDGASVAAANLALAFGRAGYRTLLMDCNFRQPVIQRQPTIQGLFELTGESGLATVLTHQLDPRSAVQSTHHPEVFVLTAGQNTTTSVDALGSFEMSQVVNVFRVEYDVVIMSAPAMREAPDAATLSPMSDLVLLVGWAGRTRSRELQQSIDALERSGGMPAGVVLNGVGREKVAPPPPDGQRATRPLAASSSRLPAEAVAQKNSTD